MRQLLRLYRYLHIFTPSRQEWRAVHNRKSTDCFMTNLEDLNGASVSRQFLCHTYLWRKRAVAILLLQGLFQTMSCKDVQHALHYAFGICTPPKKSRNS